MLKGFAFALLLALSTSSTLSAGAPAPPTKLTLIVPANGTYSTIPDISYGVSIPENFFVGGRYNITFTLMYPNGSSVVGGGFSDSGPLNALGPNTCSRGGSGVTGGNFFFSQTQPLPAGVYQILANVTTMTPSSFFSSNGTCFVPFTYESLLVKDAWEFVSPPATSGVYPDTREVTTTAALPQSTAKSGATLEAQFNLVAGTLVAGAALLIL
ncbi:hypothetical protein T439DRAFT_376565 [Meredithblackwellia eburnea MCA 4105]